MINYDTFSDEQLVVEYQKGDKTCLEILLNRYNKFLEVKSRKANERYPQIDYEDFHSQYTVAFWKAVDKFDITKSAGYTFRYWLTVRATKSIHALINAKLYKDNIVEGKRTRNIVKETLPTVSIESLTETQVKNGKEITVEVADPNAKVDIEGTKKEEETELYKILASKSEKDAKIAILVARGYKYDQIIKELNLNNKMAVTRALKRNQEVASKVISKDVLKEYKSVMKKN